jgi:hypothetical protein
LVTFLYPVRLHFGCIIAAAGSKEGLYYIMFEILKEPKISCFFVGKFSQNFKMDKNKCPKTDLPKYFPQKHAL